MEKIQFDLTKYPNRLDQLNIYATFIVNRAAAFDGLKYKRIIVDFNDSPKGCATYSFMQIIASIKNIPIYTNWHNKKSRYVTKDKHFHYRPRFWIDHLEKKEDTLYLDAESTLEFEITSTYPKIYSGFSKKEIEEIGKKLYGWQDDLLSYKQWRKEMDKMYKELKRESNNN